MVVRFRSLVRVTRPRNYTTQCGLVARKQSFKAEWQSLAAKSRGAMLGSPLGSGWRMLSSGVGSVPPVSADGGQKQEGEQVVDANGDTWTLKKDGKSGDWFYYNERTWESRDDRPKTKEETEKALEEARANFEKPKYATDWFDPNYPDWVQYVEFNSKRKYYHNVATNEVTWAPPDQPDLNIFEKEIEEQNKGLMAVPDDAEPGSLMRRLAAGAVDFGLSFATGIGFGFLVYVDVDSVVAGQVSVGLCTWCVFMARDMIFEHGTRSPGKRLLKLEIVRSNGQLPSRYNTFFRNIYTPLHLGFFQLHPLGGFLFSASDLALMMFTPNRTRIGDVIGRTRVIAELPDRQKRMEELEHEIAEEEKKE